MKILLVNLHFEKNEQQTVSQKALSYNYKNEKYIPFPSLTLRQLSSLTPEKHDLYLLDTIHDVTFDEDYDLVGISTVTPSSIRAYEIADEFRNQNTPVVLGGFHPSALPEEAKQHADAVVIGEAEYTWPKLLNDFESNSLKKYYNNTKPVDAKDIPIPDRETFKNDSVIEPIQATRGCSNSCSFCSISNTGFKNIYRMRPIEHIVEEVKRIKQKYLFFCDACLALNPNYAKKLFNSLIPFEKKLLMCSGTVDVLARDEYLIKISNEAGCINWLIGFESISELSLNEIGKKTNKIDNYKKAVDLIHDYSMAVVGEFVFGFDNDTPDIFKKTEELINLINIDVPGFNVLTPYPGTPIFNKFEKENRLLTKDWSKYTINNVVFQPKQMTPKKLSEGVKYLNEKFEYTLDILYKWLK